MSRNTSLFSLPLLPACFADATALLVAPDILVFVVEEGSSMIMIGSRFRILMEDDKETGDTLSLVLSLLSLTCRSFGSDNVGAVAWVSF